MKTKISLCMLGIVAMLASCSQTEEVLPQNAAVTTITATLDNGMITRTISDTEDDAISRCLLEVLDAQGNKVEINPKGENKNRLEGTPSSGAYSFTAYGLEEGQDYTFLLWADGGSSFYTADDLTSIKVVNSDVSTAGVGIAYSASVSKKPEEIATGGIELTHTVSKITLKTTSNLEEGKEVDLEVPTYKSFNVQEGDIPTTETASSSVTKSSSVAVTVESGATSAEVFSLYVLSKKEGTDGTASINYDNYTSPTVLNNLPINVNKHLTLEGDISKIGPSQTTFTATLTSTWNSESTTFPVNVNETTHTITQSEAGLLTTDLITQAVGEGNALKIEGLMNANDLANISTWVADHENVTLALDLSATTGLTEIPDDVFFRGNVPGITGYSMPNPGLASVELPTGITKIGANAFRGCINLKSVNFPDLNALKSIGAYAFAPTNNTDDVEHYGKGLQGEIVIPEGVIEVGRYFIGCSGVTKVTLPVSLTSFTKGNEFGNLPKLETLVFNGDVTSVGYAMFGYDTALTSIDLSKCSQVPTLNGSSPGAAQNLFAGVTKGNVNIKVKANLKSNFEAAGGWSECTYITE